MVEPSVLKRMTDYASLNKNDIVLEIGAGLGFLTSFIAEKCRGVLAVELDPKLAKILREQFRSLSSVDVIEGDVFKVQIGYFNKVVSIPPYNISSSLLLWLFDQNFDCAVLIFQKEFANRLVASIGSEDYGWLTVITYYYFEVELLDVIPKWMFYPQPEVDSIIVRLKSKKPKPFVLKDEMLFRKLAQILFKQRNRKVKNAISTFIKTTPVKIGVARSLPFCDRRVRRLAPEDFGELANVLAK